MKVHTEATFERLITEHLILHGGYEPRNQTSYDPDGALATHAGYDVQRALIPTEVVAFIQATQPKPWAKLQAIHGAALDGLFLDALCKVMNQRGALSVIRQSVGWTSCAQSTNPTWSEPRSPARLSWWTALRLSTLQLHRGLKGLFERT